LGLDLEVPICRNESQKIFSILPAWPGSWVAASPDCLGAAACIVVLIVVLGLFWWNSKLRSWCREPRNAMYRNWIAMGVGIGQGREGTGCGNWAKLEFEVWVR